MSQISALGLDVGSTTAKMVGVDSAGRLVWHLLEPADPRVSSQVVTFLRRAREQSVDVDNVPLVATGYGRKLVEQAGRKVTEITCHARGVFASQQRAGTLIDIGGQDSKVIVFDDSGQVQDFAMNDKCAAGTGRFLENTAARLGLRLDQLGEVALSTREEVSISSTCTVFAESEIVSLIAHGVAVAPIVRSLLRSLTRRVSSLAHSVGIKSCVWLSGGVARIEAVRAILQEELDQEVVVPKFPQLMGAYGAALIALGK